MAVLEGKTALITGGSSGIGKEIARLFQAEGARVAITGRGQAALDEACGELGGGVVGYRNDAADIGVQRELAEAMQRQFGQLDILIANAGVINLAPTVQVTPEDFDHQFGVNARGLFFGVQALLPVMAEGGSIVVVSSLAATRVLENHAVYAGSKAAAAAFARSWALELKERRIRVNVLSPGPVETPILGKLGVAEADRPAFLKMMSERIPTGGMGRGDQIAQAALFLASGTGSFVNGAELHADGGMLLT